MMCSQSECPTQKVIMTETQGKIKTACYNMGEFLIEKNRRYGNSALKPMRVFSKGKDVESLLVRLDDKLSRIRNAEDIKKNDITDLIGYLVLLCVGNGWLDYSEFLD